MAFGLRFAQKLEGTYHRLSTPGDERPIELELRVFVEASSFRTRQSTLSGTLHAPGLAERNAITRGHFTLHVDGRVRYDFQFGDEMPRRFYGETEWALLRPKRSLERVFGRVFENDEEVARVLLHTPLEQSLIQLLLGVRPTRF